ncbi:uncharacterized protein LOC127121126 [Lathyrus oleraceus]|uniref:Uncharacterized protein n=1 Tax=Pisum sativum TaxID=3888 RepID=A0A9D4Y869_PEA|nr:uncharacterized protein LOC127121126 [Pisum sativum]KAI5434127.1 hypothetical protein KIW84_021115 [Pisum sativum]
MKCRYFAKEESDLVDTMVTSDNDDATKRLKDTKLDARFLSFLEKDDSFLTPWSWNPNAFKNKSASTKEKEYLSFHPESYFNFQIIDEKIQNENAQENYKQCSSSARSCSKDSYPAPLNLVITKAPTYLPVSYYYRNMKCNRSKKHGGAILKDPKFIRV